MKLRILLIIFALLIVKNANAQDEQLDSLDFEEQNYEQFEDETKSGYMVFGGGFVMNLLNLNFDEINNLIKKNNFNPKNEEFSFDAPFYQFGAQGIVAIGLIPNIRIGVIGVSGSKSPTRPIIFDTNGITIERNIRYEAGFTGINVDYAFVPFKGFAIVPGMALGYGEISLTSTQTQRNFAWNDLKPISSPYNYKYEISTDYWQFSPMLNFEYAPTILSLFRVSIGYSMTLARDWYLNGNTESKVIDVPDKFNADGLTLQFGIMLGLFNY